MRELALNMSPVDDWAPRKKHRMMRRQPVVAASNLHLTRARLRYAEIRRFHSGA
jgi:hypothetical protein